MTLSYSDIASRRIDRIAALADGLFAIAMTIIVLEIRVPDPGPIRTEEELWTALLRLAPRIVTYLMSFLTLGIFWNAQQTQLNLFARADWHLTWFQLAFLAAVALMPFSTAFLADFISFRIALLVYWANIFVLGVVLYLCWLYAVRNGIAQSGPTSDAIKRRIIGAQALYAFGAALCLISTYWSIGFIVLVQLNFAIAARIPLLRRL